MPNERATIDFLHATNDVLKECGIKLPLPHARRAPGIGLISVLRLALRVGPEELHSSPASGLEMPGTHYSHSGRSTAKRIVYGTRAFHLERAIGLSSAARS